MDSFKKKERWKIAMIANLIQRLHKYRSNDSYEADAIEFCIGEGMVEL